MTASVRATRRSAELEEALREVCDVRSRPIDRLAAAHDASPYVLTPLAVATPASITEVAGVLSTAQRLGVGVTFRSGGTSLSGQAGGAGLLVDTRRGFRTIDVLDEGRRVRCGPGATVRAVNARLARHGWKLGPDPASEIACTVGGVVANNSSGMCCGVERNAYNTLESSVIVLPSGTTIDSASPEADGLLRRAEPEVHRGLLALRDRVRADTESIATIRRLFAMKNTMGYSLNAFLDFDEPVRILEHLVVGSEGTLAFLGEAVFRTVPVQEQASTALLVFPDLRSATEALPALVATGLSAIELMDATSLRVAQRDPDATDDLRSLTVEGHAALLVEFQDEAVEALESRVARARRVLDGFRLSRPARFDEDPVVRSKLWHVRKGLFALVAGARPAGTTALLEDVAVPVEHLAQTCVALTELFSRYGYSDSVIFGHAKDGNIHFMLSEKFDDRAGLARYRSFTEDLVDLVLGAGGTLKAEHGTGRAMAPFVARQYGDELYEVMCEVKALLDPTGTLNPGVLISGDPRAHLRDLAAVPPVESEVDRCVECGYCEPVCPSRDLTFTPRQRIVVRREIVAAVGRGDRQLARVLRRDYDYDGVTTCAVDGMCQTACPVGIDTGDLVRRLRREATPALPRLAWRMAAGRWDAVSHTIGIALSVAKLLPPAVPKLVTAVARRVAGAELVPSYSTDLPAGGRRRRVVEAADPVAILFSSCTTTMFGPAADGQGVATSLQELCRRAGAPVASPPDLSSLCCGTPWKSKGFEGGYRSMVVRVAESLRHATRDGELPVVCDASSCTEGLRVLLDAADASGVRVIDAVEFAATTLVARLGPIHRIPRLTLHPTCSSVRTGAAASLRTVADLLADEVIVPIDWSCCGFAGDRGLLHPELTASATAAEGREVVAVGSAAHASLNRTCELGLSRATGEPYRHILEYLDDATRQNPTTTSPNRKAR